MDKALKQRLIGAAVLIAIAVIFLPMLVKGPAPVSGAADVSLDVPAAPKDGFETRELPLGAPGAVPAGGVAGMIESSPANSEIVPPDTSVSSPAVGAGDYAVNFGHYGTSADADRMVTALTQSQLQAYAESATLGGRSAWRVRLGPYATRAEAEAARLRALHVTDKVKASVVALNADAAAPATATNTTTTATATPSAVTTQPLPPAPAPKPAPAPVEAPKKAVAAKPVETKPTPVTVAPKPVEKPATPAPKPAASNVGFAVQLGAFADASAATALRDKARAAGLSAFTETVNTANGKRTRVRIGPVADRADADKLRAQAQSKLGVAGIVSSHP